MNGLLDDTWNRKVMGKPPALPYGFGVYGGCQFKSTLSKDMEVTATICVRKSGSTTYLGHVSITTTVPANGKTKIIKKREVLGGDETGFSLRQGQTYEYYGYSPAPSGITGIYEGGVHDFRK